jgi:tRNA (guanine-N7-)-methyltransferase
MSREVLRRLRCTTRIAFGYGTIELTRIACRPFPLCRTLSRRPKCTTGAKIPPRSKCKSHQLSVGDRSALRELYDIDAPSDEQRSAQVALHHVNFLSRWQQARPIADHTLRAFRHVAEWRHERPNRPLIFDSGCGTGRSSEMLAEMFPSHDIVAIDRNDALLKRSPFYQLLGGTQALGPEVPSNILLVRADLVDFWRLAHAEGWKLDYHFLLYPNPYPKPSDIKSRIYGHPVFPIMIALGGTVEVRSSWEAYCTDFAAAASAIAPDAVVDGPHRFELGSKGSALTNFEAKYHACSQPMYRLLVSLPRCVVD